MKYLKKKKGEREKWLIGLNSVVLDVLKKKKEKKLGSPQNIDRPNKKTPTRVDRGP